MNYDVDTQKIMQYAVEDLQRFMATAGKDTTESSLLAWQQGYIAGVNRAISFESEQSVEEYE
jgi:hypothetical protein